LRRSNPVVVHNETVEHGVDDPGQQRFIDFNRPGTVVRRNFVEIIVRFFEDLRDRFVLCFRVLFDKGLESGSGEDIFLDFQPGFQDRSHDALTVAMNLQQQVAAQNERLVGGVTVPDIRVGQEGLQANGLADLDEGPAGFFNHHGHAAPAAEGFFRAEKKPP
jgi:hypothetical protein